MATRSILAGCGAYLPDRVIDNNELAKLVDTSMIGSSNGRV